MKWRFLAAIGAVALVVGCAGPELEIDAPAAPHDGHPNDHKSRCHGGCSLAHHPIPPFTDADFVNTLEDYGQQPVGVESPALDKLLFYGQHSLALLQERGAGGLSEQHLEFLKRELARQTAVVSLRLVADDGAVQAAVDRRKVPIGIKQHLHPERFVPVQDMEFSGTLLRTDLGHIWARF